MHIYIQVGVVCPLCPADVLIRFWRYLDEPKGVCGCLFLCFQRAVSVSWAVSRRKQGRWCSWTRWCMMGPAAATQTPSAYVLEESVWYVFTLVAFEKNVIHSLECYASSSTLTLHLQVFSVSELAIFSPDWRFLWSHKRLQLLFFTYAVILPKTCKQTVTYMLVELPFNWNF